MTSSKLSHTKAHQDLNQDSLDLHPTTNEKEVSRQESQEILALIDKAHNSDQLTSSGAATLREKYLSSRDNFSLTEEGVLKVLQIVQGQPAEEVSYLSEALKWGGLALLEIAPNRADFRSYLNRKNGFESADNSSAVVSNGSDTREKKESSASEASNSSLINEIDSRTFVQSAVAPVNLGASTIKSQIRNIGDNTTILTFDDGPSPDYTRRVLDILDANNMKGTFFVVGAQVKEHPELVREIVARGHEIGVHSYTHADMTQLSRSEVAWEIDETVREIRKALGSDYHPRWFRAPYGAANDVVTEEANKRGLGLVHWTVDTRDWNRSSQSSHIRGEIDKGGGDIVLLHDSVDVVQEMLGDTRSALVNKYSTREPHPQVTSSKEAMLEGLAQSLPSLRQQGVRGLTLSGAFHEK